MANEIMTNIQMEKGIQQISVEQGSIRFGAYQDLKEQATKLAEQIQTVEVNEDNVKLSKKLLAEVNKRVKTLEDKRIEIKKHMLEPYQEFESQVKEIVGIVKDADSTVRGQVKQLEEHERMTKENEIREIWEKRIQQYSFKDFVPFVDFCKPKHLGKSVSIASVEKEMVQFLEKIENDMNVIYQMDDVNDHINAYLNTYDLGQAMTIVKNHKERKAQIEQARKQTKKEKLQEDVFVFTLFNQKDMKMVEMFMEQNDIKYQIDEGMME